LACSSWAPLSFAADWPQWHGLHRDNRSPETGLLKEWPADGLKPVWVTVRQLMKVSHTFEAGRSEARAASKTGC